MPRAASRKKPTTTRSTEQESDAAPSSRRISGMLRPSRERIIQLAAELVDALARTKAVTLLKERDVVRHAVAQALAEELKREEERELLARKRIAAMRGAPRPETPEWEELFRRIVEEELLREGLDS